ncbi:IclR family transcriptional regulator [Streptomyces sp. NPDC091219]|uniref:IclR family transcriptional regulator n=1 Tax=Streptomyces sp. NPDC091219 TaxID=3155193 RepID=UPI00344E9259
MLSRGAEDERQGIQSVEIAMTVVHALEQGPGPMSLKQVAEASGMASSKVHRYLVSLSRAGLVAQSPSTGRYDLGPAARRLGIEALRRMDDVEVVSDHLPALRDRTGHSVNLTVWGDHGPVVVRWHYGSHALPITIRLGAVMPLTTSSAGRVFLTHLPAALTEPVLRAEVESGTAPELGTAEIGRIKDEVRSSGVAVTANAMIPGVTSVASAVFTELTPLPLVVAIALPNRESGSGALEDVTRELLHTTAAACAELGARPPAV